MKLTLAQALIKHNLVLEPARQSPIKRFYSHKVVCDTRQAANAFMQDIGFWSLGINGNEVFLNPSDEVKEQEL